jgi:hypothetical protein
VDDLKLLDFRLRGLRQYVRFEGLKEQILKLFLDIPQAALIHPYFRLKPVLVFQVLIFWL